MHITKVELKDFKSHADSQFEFSGGTTAITGENGAGKTSIIEAIAWTLSTRSNIKRKTSSAAGRKKARPALRLKAAWMSANTWSIATRARAITSMIRG